MKKNLSEVLMKFVFAIAACTSIAAVALICIFLFINGVPAMAKIGVLDFLLGTTWKPGSDIYGILPMILGSIYVTALAIAIGVPIGFLTAVYLQFFCPKKIGKKISPAINLLAGIPSVVYGFFGIVVLVPFVRTVFNVKNGSTMLTASLLLGIMILPTIINVTQSALAAVPSHYYEGALALGASHERSVFFASVPAAKSGILAAVVLGIGRAIGETMAVMMVAGNWTKMPSGLLKGVRTLTTNIVIEMGYAADMHRSALIATAVVLFVLVMLVNLSFSAIVRGGSK